MRNSFVNSTDKLGTKKSISLITVLIIILIISSLVSIGFGAVNINIEQITKILAHNVFGVNFSNMQGVAKGSSYEIVWNLRFPRILLAIAVGGGLSIVGVVMQAMVQNPMADPYILGISSGATLGATLSIMLGVGVSLGVDAVGVCGFIGALACSIFVYLLSGIGGRVSSVKLVLSGLIIGSICSSFTSFIIYVGDNVQGMRSLQFWLMGSLAGASWKNVGFPSIIFIVGFIFFFFQFRVLNTMLMGDEHATTLGIDLNKYRKLYMVITSLITGVLVYAAGMIGFVGLVIPHIVRSVVGCDHRKLLPTSALIGAIFMIITDVIARSITQAELPIGIITSMVGAPVFMYLMIKKTYGFGGR